MARTPNASMLMKAIRPEGYKEVVKMWWVGLRIKLRLVTICEKYGDETQCIFLYTNQWASSSVVGAEMSRPRIKYRLFNLRRLIDQNNSNEYTSTSS
jgi:hypothetical protein